MWPPRTLFASFALVALIGSTSQAQDAEPTGHAASGPAVEMGRRGLSVTSEDGRYGLSLRAWTQLSGRFYLGDDDELATDELVVRRLRSIMTLRADEQFSARVAVEMSSGVVLFDAYLDWTPTSAASLRLGLTKTPLGLEFAQGPPVLQFIERALPTLLVPNRDLGLMFHGAVGEGYLQYQAGVFNGVPDGTNGSRNVDDHFDIAARLVVRPFATLSLVLAGLDLGVGVTWGEEAGSASSPVLPTYVTTGRRAFFRYANDGTPEGTAVADGTRLRLAASLYYHLAGFQLLGEYVLSWQDVSLGATAEELNHSAWLAGASYVIGGPISLAGASPTNPIGRDGGMGALEIKARVAQITVDEAAFSALGSSGAERATEIAGGLTWWLSSNVRVLVDYFHTTLEEPTGGAGLQDEDVLIGTVQLGL